MIKYFLKRNYSSFFRTFRTLSTKLRSLLFSISIFFGIFLLCVAWARFGKYSYDVPSIRIRFISPRIEKIPIEFSYTYRGYDVLRGEKFGGYGSSGILYGETGDTIHIPKNTITSYWPFSEFERITIYAQETNKKDAQCFWEGSIESKEFADKIQRDLVNTNIHEGTGVYLLDNVHESVIELSCNAYLD